MSSVSALAPVMRSQQRAFCTSRTAPSSGAYSGSGLDTPVGVSNQHFNGPIRIRIPLEPETTRPGAGAARHPTTRAASAPVYARGAPQAENCSRPRQVTSWMVTPGLPKAPMVTLAGSIGMRCRIFRPLMILRANGPPCVNARCSIKDRNSNAVCHGFGRRCSKRNSG